MARIKWKAAFCAAAVILLVGGLLWVKNRPFAVTTFSSVRMGGVTVIVDAGHGGEDGGAVSEGGTVESQINLAIASKLDALLHLYGVSTVMVREDDRSIHDASAETLREKKRSDLKNRVALVNDTPNGVLISIHQNVYPDRNLSGAQVFYSDVGSSYDWAVLTQELLRTTLDESNHRKAAQISDTIYLMKNITRPAILVECGFLSHPEEEKKLQDSAYQTKIAAALMASSLQYYGGS